MWSLSHGAHIHPLNFAFSLAVLHLGIVEEME